MSFNYKNPTSDTFVTSPFSVDRESDSAVNFSVNTVGGYMEVYYLRDLETNELYDIKNNGHNQVVGLINSKGRVKFN